MARPVFYYNVIKNIIVAFGSIFDDVHYLNDTGVNIHVPISYAPKSKFVEFYNSEPSFDTFDVKYTLPRMAFEMTGLNFAPERFSNPLGRVNPKVGHQFMFTRVPYDYAFTLYLATKSFEDSLKIIEQIVPYFTPELNLTLNDKADFGLKTDVPVMLNSVAYTIDYEGSFENKRTIEWTLGFTVKGYMYSDVKAGDVIKETIVNLTQEDSDKRYEQLLHMVDPKIAGKADPHTVKVEKKGEGDVWTVP